MKRFESWEIGYYCYWLRITILSSARKCSVKHLNTIGKSRMCNTSNEIARHVQSHSIRHVESNIVEITRHESTPKREEKRTYCIIIGFRSIYLTCAHCGMNACRSFATICCVQQCIITSINMFNPCATKTAHSRYVHVRTIMIVVKGLETSMHKRWAAQ